MQWAESTLPISRGLILTYSIVARCQETGQLGVAVQSHWFASGIVCWARAGVGAVATQAMALIDHGPLGLELMASGYSASEALEIRINKDESPEIRQVAMVDSKGTVAAHTGSSTIPEANHIVEDGFSCQANMMWNPTVCQAMAEAFNSTEGQLAERLLASLHAGQAEGGDIRGMQSGRILVVHSEPLDKAWEEIIVDLRVDDHPEPLVELSRLLAIHKAYSNLNEDESGVNFDSDLGDDYPEIAFWKGVALANQGKVRESRELIKIALNQYEGWRELLLRCSKRGLAGITEETVRILLNDEPLEID